MYENISNTFTDVLILPFMTKCNLDQLMFKIGKDQSDKVRAMQNLNDNRKIFF